jgi:hypothetical protein
MYALIHPIFFSYHILSLHRIVPKTRTDSSYTSSDKHTDRDEVNVAKRMAISCCGKNGVFCKVWNGFCNSGDLQVSLCNYALCSTNGCASFVCKNEVKTNIASAADMPAMSDFAKIMSATRKI